jgi:dihydrofolate reductase
MRKVIYHAQTTLDLRIANAEGTFWEPFPWGEEETAYVNDVFRSADTWALGRNMYDAIVPWWRAVADGNPPEDAGELTGPTRDFGEIFAGLTVAVFSRTLTSDATRTVLDGDPVEALWELKRQPGRAIMYSSGPQLLAPIAAAPGLVDEYLFAVHPIVLAAGPRVFDRVETDLPLRLEQAKIFDGGTVILRYRPA